MNSKSIQAFKVQDPMTFLKELLDIFSAAKTGDIIWAQYMLFEPGKHTESIVNALCKATANGAIYTGVIYAPTTQINGAFSNTTFNGSLYSKTVSFGSGTSLTAKQVAGFPTTTYPLPL